MEFTKAWNKTINRPYIEMKHNLTISQIVEYNSEKKNCNDNHLIYSPNSIYHGDPISDKGSYTLQIKLLRGEIERYADFLSYLFEVSEHCDHISQRDAWKEFELYEFKEAMKNKN